MGDLTLMIPPEEADICILEEPEHLNWYAALAKWPTMIGLRVVSLVQALFLSFSCPFLLFFFFFFSCPVVIQCFFKSTNQVSLSSVAFGLATESRSNQIISSQINRRYTLFFFSLLLACSLSFFFFFFSSLLLAWPIKIKPAKVSGSRAVVEADLQARRRHRAH